MKTTPYLSEDEVREYGFKSVGKGVMISRKASIYSPHTINIGDYVRIDDFVVVTSRMGIEIGNYVHISCLTFLHGHAIIRIGNFVQISSRVGLYTSSADFGGESLTHPLIPVELNGNSPLGPIIIGDYAIVGAGTTVLEGVSVGEGTVVGANSLVKYDLEPWSVYAGSPVRKLKARPSENILRSAAEVLNQQKGSGA